jgi:chorismate synthase
MNTFGNYFRIHSFGESHGKAVGLVIDGCPAGLELDVDLIQKELDKRRPGQSNLTTQRNEKDQIEVLSGVFEGKTTGAPLAMLVYNQDQKSQDYDALKNVFRPSHADFVYQKKYGLRDHRGGGRSSARETLTRVAGGAVAKQLIKSLFPEIQILAYVSQVGHLVLDEPFENLDFSIQNKLRCPHSAMSEKMEAFIEEVKFQGDTVGGRVSGRISGLPVGLGEPVFGKLHALLGFAMLSINAVKGFEYGSGFASAAMRGSQHNDSFRLTEAGIGTQTNFSGGVQGGISNGEPIYFNVAFKPVATISQKQNTVNDKGEPVELQAKGRHDPCVVPRAVPIVEAMAALVLADLILAERLSKLQL